RPLFTFSLMLDAQIGDISPAMYHFTNILIRIFSSCLFFLLLTKLSYKSNAALFASLIFVIHPALTQSVAWIPGRIDALLGVFILASFIFYINFLQSNRKRDYLLHILFFGCSLFVKETAVVMPAVCVLYVLLILKTKIISFQNGLLVAGWLAALGSWYMIRASVLERADEKLSGLSMALLHNLTALIQQAGKMLLPFNMSTMPTIEDTSYLFGIGTIIILIIAFYNSEAKQIPRIIFGLCWFMFFLLPTYVATSVFQHDTRLYVPMIGFSILVMETDVMRNINLSNKKTLQMCMLILIIMFITTFSFSRKYTDRFTFWEDAAINSPHSGLTQKVLGINYSLKGEFDKAEAQYVKAIQLDSYSETAYNNLGLIYMNRNELEKAENEFKKEIEINPQFDLAYYNLGLAYSRQGKIQEAWESWQKTLVVNPQNADALNSIALLYFQQEKYKEAADIWLSIIRLHPDYLNAYENLVTYYHKQNDLPKAVYYVEQLRSKGVPIPPQILKELNMN
ncbi:MAG: tetratricopeptide repeat protein, partial [Deltaproteobacteria bacterium]|nr:tetratricopeptide repeat protein [Deltaproteobacteria bacterium]